MKDSFSTRDVVLVHRNYRPIASPPLLRDFHHEIHPLVEVCVYQKLTEREIQSRFFRNETKSFNHMAYEDGFETLLKAAPYAKHHVLLCTDTSCTENFQKCTTEWTTNEKNDWLIDCSCVVCAIRSGRFAVSVPMSRLS